MSSKAALNNFKDDEEIVAKKDASGDRPASFIVGTAKATIINKTEAPLEETEFNALLELTGSGLSTDRIGVDIVAVLDVSGSMGGDQRLQKLQRAMQFVIRKLSPIDRLSIVSFNSKADRLCPFRQATEDSQPQIENIVNNLKAGGGTDIVAGVFKALEVVKERRYTEGRTAAIMVMSDGKTNNDNISTLEMKEVPVFTFGLSSDHDSKVLNNIAKGSKGGTYSDIQDTSTLGLAFSQCLAGLLTLVVEDLTLTVTPLTVPKLEPTVIVNVNAGYYPRPKDLNTVGGSVTVSFGNLYDQEVRKVLLELLLPKAISHIGMDVLRASVTYKSRGKVLNAPPILVTVTRTEFAANVEKDEVIVELKRLRAARTIRKARELGDDGKLNQARDELTEMQEELKNVVLSESSALIDSLIAELKQLFGYMIDEKTYKTKGRPFALSAETSHSLQRFAARGDIEKLRVFATARMNAYLEQAKKFENNDYVITSSVADAEEDVAAAEKAAAAANPLAAIIAALSAHVSTAVESLKAIEKLLDIGGL